MSFWREKRMKKVLVFVLMLVAVFGLGFINSVPVFAKGAPAATTAPVVVPVYEGTFDGYVTGYESTSYALLAGQSIAAGTVVMTTDGTTLFVTVNGTYDLNSIHIYLYEAGQTLPTARPVPGQAPYKLENIDGNTATLSLPLSAATSYVLAVHVSFDAATSTSTSNVAGQTAYAANNTASYTGRGAWYYLVSFNVVKQPIVVNPEYVTRQETAYAYFGSTSIPFNQDASASNAWGWYTTYQEGTFPVYAGAGQNDLNKGTLVGYITVSGTTVTFVPFDNVTVLEQHFYIGGNIPTRVPGRWQTISQPLVYMTFHLSVEITEEV